MKQATTGTLSGCFVWVIAFGVMSMCILPISMAIGGFTSVTDFAIQQTGAIICPKNTTPDVRTYATTTTDEFGNSQPSTAYVLQCKDTSGNVVKEDPVGYAFLWIGIIMVIGLLITGLLAFFVAAPAGVLIAKLLARFKVKGGTGQ
ncbi:MAG: hypothetical protein Q7J80_03725 [Anaerolineales bacterium]|nr:hypothetical protein [Anaerolineales bacterium]